jgi:sn-glycerol 3-phosphate transport system substrate-binding protein
MFRLAPHLKLSICGLILSLFIGVSESRTTITWWHAMGGTLGEKVVEIAKGFNEFQTEFTVKPIYKGNYTETMTSAVAAFRARKQPHIVQVFEVGTATMMAAKGAIYPIYKVMKDSKEPFEPKDYLAAVTGYYTDSDGNMLSMPFNSSTPVLYYNKEAFRLAGFDPEQGPKTWNELETYSRKLQEIGYPCGFTTGWQSWTQLENFSAWHNQPFASLSNGFDGLDAKLEINSPLQIRHIESLARWQKSKIFGYGGRRSDSAPKFYNGECAMYINSSASYSAVKGNVNTFQFGVSTLPYWAEVEGAPQNSIIGGASLWVLTGHKPEEYKAVARFFTYLSSPTVQADWHQFTGYLPITKAAYELTQKQGFYRMNPGTEIGIKQMTGKEPTQNSKGIRLGNFTQIREILNEELEAIWAGSKKAKAGLDDAVTRSNVLLRKFQRANKH